MRFSLPDLTDQAVGVHVAEAQELLHALQPLVRRSQSLWLPLRVPPTALVRAQLQGTHLIKTYYDAVFWFLLIKVEDAPFFSSKSGSFDCFQVLVRW